MRRESAGRLAARYGHLDGEALLAALLSEGAAGRLALVSSFGAEAAVLLHMAARVDPALPVIFLDTHKLFSETLDYQARLARVLGLRDVRVIRPAPEDLDAEDPEGDLHRRDPDRCCRIRKTRPLARALAGFDGWITGRKRYQSGRRAGLDVFEEEPASGRVKINPLARWTPEEIRARFEAHRLPRHPLASRGYPSIGCAPCTTPVAPGEPARAGRWRGLEKEECGLHLVDGALVPARRPA